MSFSKQQKCLATEFADCERAESVVSPFGIQIEFVLPSRSIYRYAPALCLPGGKQDLPEQIVIDDRNRRLKGAGH